MSVTSYKTSIQELGGGRIAVLLLLFALALYQFYSAGFEAFALICILPVFAIAVIAAFRFKMFLFWSLIVINFILQWKNSPLPSGIPMSLYNEALEILLILMAMMDIKDSKFEACLNEMLYALAIWCTFIILQLMNDTCEMAWDFAAWFTGARIMAFQLLYAFLVFTICINTPDKLIKYFFLWGGLTLFAVFWIYKQKNIGLTSVEKAFYVGSRTHVLNGGTLIRYFSTFCDAANAGIYFASASVAFIIAGITSKVKKYRYFFLFVGIAALWAMFPTGTRTATFCFLAGFMVYIVLAKSVKLTAFIGTAGLLFFLMLAFTNIGDSNQMIRRMRTAFDKNDASSGVRKVNQEVMKKYLADAPFGIGIGIRDGSDLASNHKYHIMSTIPPDSEYVYIWIHTGIVGITIFLVTTALIFLGASRIVMFKLTSSSLRGIGGGLICAFVSAQLGGYGNQVLMQFPICLTFYGGISLVYVLPYIEDEWIKHEEKLLAAQKEKKRLKEENKKANRIYRIRH